MRPDNNLKLHETLEVVNGYDSENFVLKVNGVNRTVEISCSSFFVNGVDVMKELADLRAEVRHLRREIVNRL